MKREERDALKTLQGRCVARVDFLDGHTVELAVGDSEGWRLVIGARSRGKVACLRSRGFAAAAAIFWPLPAELTKRSGHGCARLGRARDGFAPG